MPNWPRFWGGQTLFRTLQQMICWTHQNPARLSPKFQVLPATCCPLRQEERFRSFPASNALRPSGAKASSTGTSSKPMGLGRTSVVLKMGATKNSTRSQHCQGTSPMITDPISGIPVHSVTKGGAQQMTRMHIWLICSQNIRWGSPSSSVMTVKDTSSVGMPKEGTLQIVGRTKGEPSVQSA